MVHGADIKDLYYQAAKEPKSAFTHVEWQEITRAERGAADFSREPSCRANGMPWRSLLRPRGLAVARHGREWGGVLLLLLLLSDIGSGARGRGGARENDAWS
jgi:hypothetical protein